MDVTLIIDTSQTDSTRIAISYGGKQYEKTSSSRTLRSQMVLPLIEDLLSEHALHISDIKEITVATGPGSFTGLRVGISVANALGSLLSIPVNGKKALVNPVY
jgi:tRNA threonylcarbamoyladenosine biosynthesis protein TsaB